MQMLYRNGQAKPTQEQIDEQLIQQQQEDDKSALDFRQRLTIDRSIFSRDAERRADLHLQLSEKYMIYKDYAERAMINPQNIVKGDNRVFYLRPETIFLEDPRLQNTFRNDFLKQISTPPQPEPFTIIADDFQKAMIEDIMDKSLPNDIRHMMVQFYKRRQYKLQHKRYKYLQRWAHFALTSELVDKVSLKFSPNYSKVQFELENSIKRHQRLEGEDHFATTEKRPQRLEANGDIVHDDLHAESLPKQSALRIDDIDVYNRIVTYEEKCSRAANKFINKAKWAPLSHRFDAYRKHQEYFQKMREESLAKQEAYVRRVEEKGNYLIDHRKLGEIGAKELRQLIASLPHSKREKKASPLIKDKFLAKVKQTYEMPPMILWNQIDLKLALADLCIEYKINGDNMEVDNGNSFSYAIIVQFPTIFFTQVIKTQFAYVDSVPNKMNPAQLGKKNIQKVLQRNMKKYGKSTGSNTLLELIEIKKEEERMNIEYLNQVEKALFGAFNDGQQESVPKVRLAKSTWLDWVCFKPELSKEQQQQAAFLAGERNPLDDCACYMMEILNVNDVTNVNLTLESISQIQYEKLKHGQIKSDFLRMDRSETQSYFTEDQMEFLTIFSSALKTKSEIGLKKDEIDIEEVGKNSLFETTQHLLFAHYLLQALSARDCKAKLLYTLNAFRSIQKRLTLDLREFGSRDRVMGDINIVKPMERQQIQKLEGASNEDTDDYYSPAVASGSVGGGNPNKGSQAVAATASAASAQDIDNIIADEMVDINRFRYQNQLSNIIYSTCPIIPKFHTTFGEPIDRQEISSEFELTKDADPKKGEAQRLMGRLDTISFDHQNEIFIVTDDYGFNLMYDCTFSDMRALEQELLKIVSFYINKVEPMTDKDLRNVLPNVDRLGIIKEVLFWEEKYQKAKLRLCLQYIECYEHTCDTLEQQRLIQIVVDLMAQRPRMNLAANHFKDSYRAEIDALTTLGQIMKEFIRMQMDVEFRVNNEIREILEKTYRLVYEQIDNQMQIYPKTDVEDEKTKREIQNQGVAADEGHKLELLKEIQARKPGMFHAKKFATDPMQFAEMLGVPFSSLEMLMKQHHERDPVVKTSLHEHVSFIKIQEGYPIFLYETAVKSHNKVKLTPESSRDIGILDFYESLANLPRIVSAIKNCCQELHNVHKPDNGFMSAALELVTLQFLHAELKAVRAEEIGGDRINSARDLDLIADDSIVGNPDKMLFHMKELVASIEDPNLVQNPFVMTKLDLKTIDDFNFDDHQGATEREAKGKKPDRVVSQETITKVVGLDDANSVGPVLTNSDEEKSIGDVYMEGFKEEDSEDDFEKKLQMQQNNKSAQYPRLKQKKFRANIPSLLEISCNALEVIRIRSLLIDALIQREDLMKVYKVQTQLMAKEGRVMFKDPFNFSTFLSGTVASGRWKNFVDTGPGHSTAYPTSMAICEFDPTMIACINFSDPEAFKALLCPLGLEELRLVFRYELMNLNMLIVAVRTNQILLDNNMRQLAEMDLLCEGYAVSNPVNLFQTNLNELNYKRLPDERRNTAFAIQSKVGPNFFNIMNRKNRSREKIEKTFQKCRLAIVASSSDKTELLLRMMRTCRMMLAHDYCEEMTGAICLDSLKLELLNESNEMRKRAYLLPRDSMVHKLPPARNGEHSFAMYREEDNEQKILFYDQEQRKIQNYWAVPSFNEIMAIDQQFSQFTAINHSKLYTFNYGDPESKDQFGRSNSPSEFIVNNQRNLIKPRLPRVTQVDASQSEQQVQLFHRLTDFKECYKFMSNRTFNYLYYIRQFQNLFDLEFFANKLPSKSFSIAGLEQAVLSGAPFWEDGADAEDLSSDEYLDNPQVNNPMYADQSDAVESPHRNVLAQKMVDRIAEEKRSKVKLLQEIETIKDKFAEWERHMRCLELASDLKQAGEFLNQLVQQNYYNFLLVFMSMQDSHGAAGTALKEMHQIREVTRLLSHQDDQKVTYTNGFHVNQAVTMTERIALDENTFRPDYDNFFKAVQPVIDEEAMNPTEFILLSGLFLSKYTNNYSYRKDRRYTGYMPQRDYHYLDCKLINIDKDIRKYISSSLIGIDSQSKTYSCVRLNTTEKQYVYSNNLYWDVFQERKIFNKQMIRSKILKRALMILMSKNPLPTERVHMKALMAEFTETFSWKVMTKLDEIERQRQLAATQDSLKRQKLEAMRGDQVKAMQSLMVKKTEKANDNILQQYDQATCEVDVFQHEIRTYMILTGKRMIERETNSLAKCFEMNGKRQQILIHPMQQFASTFDQAIDKKSHLDIINKVDSVQKMLTQFMNRCLPIETLTSGAGFTISAKDLNECLNELCRNQVQAWEIEMRTRCEQLSMQILQYENLLYTKDMQLLNLENKLKHAKEELNKIINTKVFSRGNNLIYELDMSTRQLRLMKDNVFGLEKAIKETMRLYFDKDLQQTRTLLAEQKRKFKEYQLTLNSYMRENVTQNINHIDEVMKKRVEAYKDVHNEQDTLEASGSAKKLGSQSQKSVSHIGSAAHLLERPNERRKELMEKYSHLLKKTKVNTEIIDPFHRDTNDHGDNYEVIFEEMERLKESENEARNEVILLQNYLRQTRMLQKLREAVNQQKHDYKIDNLKQQLSSNAVLWEQLAEAEKREKILKQELERCQYEIATQEKIIERLRDDLRSEAREKQKLIQYKSNKSKRLGELEKKAREFEVLENVDLNKLLSMMERKEQRIQALEKADLETGIAIDKGLQAAETKVKRAQEKSKREQAIKEEAINKILEMRHRQSLLNTEDETLTVEFWQKKWQENQAGVSELREENLILHKVVHEAAQNQVMLQERIQDLQKSAFNRTAKSQAAFSTQMASLGMSSKQEINGSGFQKKQSAQLEPNPYQPTTEAIQEDWDQRQKQFIKQNNMIPKIMSAAPNLAALHLLEPQRNQTMLPVIRAKESARKVSMVDQRSGSNFNQRRKSVDPRAITKTGSILQQKSGSKRLNVFQPKGSFGAGSNELRYEEYPTNGLLKDPSVKFQQILNYPESSIFTPYKVLQANAQLLITTSTNKSAEVSRNNFNSQNLSQQLRGEKEQGTQITHGTNFTNTNSANIFSTLNVPMGMNFSPGIQTNAQHSLIMAQDQSIAGERTSASGSYDQPSINPGSYFKAALHINSSSLRENAGTNKDSLNVRINNQVQLSPLNSRTIIGETSSVVTINDPVGSPDRSPRINAD